MEITVEALKGRNISARGAAPREREKMKTGIMRIKSLLVFAGLICLVIILSTGCRRPFDNTNNVLKVDSLEQLITGIDNQLILDENVFKQRDDSMVIKLNLIHSKLPQIKDGDTSESVLRFEGIEKNYAQLLKNYPVMEYDQSAYKKSADAIKKRVVDQKISQTEFDDYYSKTKPLLSDLYKRAKTLTYDNISIEHDYQRTDEVVDALCDKLGSGISGQESGAGK